MSFVKVITPGLLGERINTCVTGKNSVMILNNTYALHSVGKQGCHLRLNVNIKTFLALGGFISSGFSASLKR